MNSEKGSTLSVFEPNEWNEVNSVENRNEHLSNLRMRLLSLDEKFSELIDCIDRNTSHYKVDDDVRIKEITSEIVSMRREIFTKIKGTLFD